MCVWWQMCLLYNLQLMNRTNKRYPMQEYVLSTTWFLKNIRYEIKWASKYFTIFIITYIVNIYTYICNLENRIKVTKVRWNKKLLKNMMKILFWAPQFKLFKTIWGYDKKIHQWELCAQPFIWNTMRNLQNKNYNYVWTLNMLNWVQINVV
jgi:hypothetical protein